MTASPEVFDVEIFGLRSGGDRELGTQRGGMEADEAGAHWEQVRAAASSANCELPTACYCTRTAFLHSMFIVVVVEDLKKHGERFFKPKHSENSNNY